MQSDQHFSLYRGETLVLPVTLTDEADPGVPFDLRGATVSWQLLNEASATTPVLLYAEGSGITIVDAENGSLSITISSDDSAGLGVKTYFHSLWVETGGGASCVPALSGNVTVLNAGPRCS